MSNLREYAITAYFRMFRDYMVRIFCKKCPRFSDIPIHSKPCPVNPDCCWTIGQIHSYVLTYIIQCDGRNSHIYLLLFSLLMANCNLKHNLKSLDI